MKNKFTKLAASIGIAFTQSANADDAIENGYSDTNSDVQLYKQPLNMETPIFLAAHGSHRSHGSHSSHGSHTSHRSGTTGGTGTGGIVPPPVETCPDVLLPLRKDVVTEVQNVMIKYNYLERSDIKTFGIMGFNSRAALRRLKKINNLPTIPGTMLDKVTLTAMGVSCP